MNAPEITTTLVRNAYRGLKKAIELKLEDATLILDEDTVAACFDVKAVTVDYPKNGLAFAYYQVEIIGHPMLIEFHYNSGEVGDGYGLSDGRGFVHFNGRRSNKQFSGICTLVKAALRNCPVVCRNNYHPVIF